MKKFMLGYVAGVVSVMALGTYGYHKETGDWPWNHDGR